VLELVFWDRRALRALVRDLIPDARTLGDDDSRARLLRFVRLQGQ
jgi:hypothetical protein